MLLLVDSRAARLLFVFFSGSVRVVDGRLDDALFWLHDLQEGEVLKVSVLDSLVLDRQLLAYLLQVLSTVQLLKGSLEALKPKNERSDVVERPTGGRSSDDNLHPIGSCLVLVVLTTASHARLDSFPVCTLTPVLAVGLATLAIPLPTFEGLSAANLVGDADLFVDTFPTHVDAVSVVEPFEDAITTNHDKVKVVLHLEALDVWLAHNHIGIAAIARSLCLNVAESLRD